MVACEDVSEVRHVNGPHLSQIYTCLHCMGIRKVNTHNGIGCLSIACYSLREEGFADNEREEVKKLLSSYGMVDVVDIELFFDPIPDAANVSHLYNCNDGSWGMISEVPPASICR